jgi:hypothetical protein
VVYVNTGRLSTNTSRNWLDFFRIFRIPKTFLFFSFFFDECHDNYIDDMTQDSGGTHMGSVPRI